MALKIVTAIENDYSIETLAGNQKLFLAGGITNCPDWQQDMIDWFELENDKLRFNNKNDLDLTVYNPRRKNFPIDDPKASEEQICWEFEKLKAADVISFWFSGGTLNPIVLYELGMWGNSRHVPIFIGIDPEYKREVDVRVQTRLARKDVKIVSSVTILAEQVLGYLRSVDNWNRNKFVRRTI